VGPLQRAELAVRRRRRERDAGAFARVEELEVRAGRHGMRAFLVNSYRHRARLDRSDERTAELLGAGSA
jgi:hypothetical protein